MVVLLRSLTVVASIVAISGGCRQSENARAEQLRDVKVHRERLLQSRLGAADSSSRPVALAQWIMPNELREISGLALLPNGRVLAHDDEVGRIYEIDPKTGVIERRFALSGSPRGDFEGITVAGDDVYLLQSDGWLFKFQIAPDGDEAVYERFNTQLGKECEFEGVAYEADSSQLVLPCKKVHKNKSLKHDIVIYKVMLPLSNPLRTTVMTIPVDDVLDANHWKEISPSDIAIDPVTRNYVLVAAREKALVILSPDGQLLKAEALPPGHEQAEGVAVTPDSILIISDEATHRPADITLYRWRR
jgi:uncharacterized protein YjiK